MPPKGELWSTLDVNSIENLTYEIHMQEKRREKHIKRRNTLIEKGEESKTEPYKGLMKAFIVSGVDSLRRSRRGKPAPGRKLLRSSKVDLKQVAFIGARTLVDGISQGHRLQTVVQKIGTRVEEEVLFKAFKAREPALWRSLLERFKERGTQDYAHKRAVVMGALKRTLQEDLVRWTHEEKVQVGLVVLDSLLEAGLCHKVVMGTGRRARPHLLLTPEAEAALSERDDVALDALRPWFKPMLRRPYDWTSVYSGGYETCDLELVKVSDGGRQMLHTVDSQDMPVVYEAVNAIQATPWRVNEDVLTVAEVLWEAGNGEAGLPLREDPPQPHRPEQLPPPPEPIPDDLKEEFKQWKVAQRDWHDARAARQSLVSQAIQMMAIARELVPQKELYFPHQLDYRGRAYAVPLILNPQGSDLARGVLMFAKGRALGDMGGYWLAVHGANVAGQDKLPLDQRADWVLEHSAQIQAVAEDPLTNRWWTEADKPFQFLAFCLEWAQSNEGADPDFVSHLPVAIDGSCNGLQHFSAMLRDPEGAEATNLTPKDTPTDIYQRVADAVQTRVTADGDQRVARQWLRYGIDRGIVKRQVMTTPYGVTRAGAFEQLRQEMRERKRAAGGELPFENEWDAAMYLSGHIFDAIGEVVMAARQAMEFLQGLARVLAVHDLPVVWTSPSGFPVVQRILKSDLVQIKTKLLGSVKLSFAHDTQKLDRRRQASCVAPNFVHSYDAAHLMLTVTAMERELGRGVSWAMVHDSFGTHAGDLDTLGRVLREQFVAIYQDADPLEDLRRRAARALPEGTELPALPPRGSFDLLQVLEAEFFFA